MTRLFDPYEACRPMKGALIGQRWLLRSGPGGTDGRNHRGHGTVRGGHRILRPIYDCAGQGVQAWRERLLGATANGHGGRRINGTADAEAAANDARRMRGWSRTLRLGSSGNRQLRPTGRQCRRMSASEDAPQSSGQALVTAGKMPALTGLSAIGRRPVPTSEGSCPEP